MGYKFEKDTSFRRKETTSLTHQGSIFSQTLFLKRLHLLRVMNRAILGPEYTFLLKHRWQKSYCEQFSTKHIFNSIHLSKSSFFSALFTCFTTSYFSKNMCWSIQKFLWGLRLMKPYDFELMKYMTLSTQA